MKICGHELEVLHAQGDPGRGTIVFLHEGLGSVSAWRDFPAALGAATGMGTLIYSRHGHGNSDELIEKRSVRYMHDEALLVLPELLSAAGIERPILLGHSDGASIALIYAGEHPDAVASVIALAPHLFVEDVSIASISAIRERFEDVSEKLSRHHRNVESTFWAWNDIWLDPAFRSWTIEDYVERITAPVLAIQGADDEYGTLKQPEALALWSGGTVDRVDLANCGHSPHRDRREFMIGAIAGWIGERNRIA